MENVDTVGAHFYESEFSNSDQELIKTLKGKNLKEIVTWLKANNAQIKEFVFPKIGNDLNNNILSNNKITEEELLLLKELNTINFHIKGLIGASEKQLYAFALEIQYMVNNHYSKKDIKLKVNTFCFDEFLDDNGVEIEEAIFSFTSKIKKMNPVWDNSKNHIIKQLMVLKSLIHKKFIVEQDVLLPRLLKIRRENI